MVKLLSYIYLSFYLLACLSFMDGQSKIGRGTAGDLGSNIAGVNFFIGVPKRGAHFMPKSEKWPKKG